MKDSLYEVWEYNLRKENDKDIGRIVGTNLTFTIASLLVENKPDYCIRVIAEIQ